MDSRITKAAIFLFLLLWLVVMVIMGNTSLDIQLHDTVAVASYSHILLITTILLVMPASIYYLFPHILGRYLSKPLGQVHFWFSVVGISTCLLGFRFNSAGYRRNLVNGHLVTLGIRKGFEILIIGAILLIFLAQISFVINLVYSLLHGKKVNKL